MNLDIRSVDVCNITKLLYSYTAFNAVHVEITFKSGGVVVGNVSKRQFDNLNNRFRSLLEKPHLYLDYSFYAYITAIKRRKYTAYQPHKSRKLIF